MFKRLLCIVGVLVGLFAVLLPGYAQQLPQEVTAALNALNKVVGQPIPLTRLQKYDWEEGFFESCSSQAKITGRSYKVSLTYDFIEYLYQVPSGTQDVRFCYSRQLPATPTWTPTWGPSPTPTRTPTPTYTPTITNTPLPTLTFTPTYTLTPSLTFTPSTTPRPDAITCPGFMASRLRVGEQANVVIGGDPNRLRDKPSVAGEQLTTLLPGSVFDVLEGPLCDASGLAWWRVRYKTFVGWTVEGMNADYFLEPIIKPDPLVTNTSKGTQPLPGLSITPTATPSPVSGVVCPGFLPSRLTIGQQGRVTPGDPNRLREKPSADSAQIGQIPGGAAFTVLAGPTCDPAGRAWWQVDYNGVVGWTVEGQGDSYYTEPVP